MDFEVEPVPEQTASQKQQSTIKLSPGNSHKKRFSDAAEQAFWLCFLAEGGLVKLSDICWQLGQKEQQAQLRLQQWHAQEWEESPKEEQSSNDSKNST